MALKTQMSHKKTLKLVGLDDRKVLKRVREYRHRQQQ